MIEIINRQSRYRINRKRFFQLLKELTSHYGVQDAEITLAFVGNQAIRQLNRDFLETDAPTDVLSFPIGEKAADDKFYLGDIIISVPYAFKQCLRREHGLEKELEYLVIHGFLHLMGYEHFKGMEEEEQKIRNRYLED